MYQEQESLFRVRFFCLQAEILREMGSNFVQEGRQYGTIQILAGSSFFFAVFAAILAPPQRHNFIQFSKRNLKLTCY